MSTERDEVAERAIDYLAEVYGRDPDEVRELLRPPTMREVVEAATRSPMDDPPFPRNEVGRAVEAVIRSRVI